MDFASYKMFRMGIEILILRFNYFQLSTSYNNICDFFCVGLGFLVHTLIALAHTLITLAHLNSTEKNSPTVMRHNIQKQLEGLSRIE